MGTRWNRLAEAVLTCTHNLCFEQTCHKKNSKHFLLTFFIFYNLKNLCMHGHVFVMKTRNINSILWNRLYMVLIHLFSSYIIMSPTSFRPGIPLNISVNILQADGPVKVTANLAQNISGVMEVKVTQSGTFNQGI